MFLIVFDALAIEAFNFSPPVADPPAGSARTVSDSCV
jgi:hypothetical protein